MQVEQILTDLDREISRLQQARALLAGTPAAPSARPTTQLKRKPGRPAGAAKLSPEGRQRIAEAMKRSWAARKKKQATGARAGKK